MQPESTSATLALRLFTPGCDVALDQSRLEQSTASDAKQPNCQDGA